MLGRSDAAVPGPEVGLEDAAEELEQDLEADLGDGRVVAALAELVADEGVLGPGEFVEAGCHPRLAELGADEVAAGAVDVGVLDAEDHGDLGVVGGEAGDEVEGVVAGWGGGRGGGVAGVVGAEGAGVDVCCEVGYAGGDAGVELMGVRGDHEGLGRRGEESYCCAEGEVAAETHARGADEPRAGWEAQEVVDGLV